MGLPLHGGIRRRAQRTRRAARPPGRQGRRRRRDDQGRHARPARFHHHHRSLPRLPCQQGQVPAWNVGADHHSAEDPRAQDRQALWRPTQSPAGQRPLRGQVLDARRRFVQMFGKTVMGIDGEKFEHALSEAKKRAGVKTDPELKPEDLRKLVTRFLAIYKDATGHEFPSDPIAQLRAAIEAVFKSWNTDRAKTYRRVERIPDDLGTAVNVQMMVFGNMGATSGTGVAFTRNPITGKKELYGDYLANAQGEDVVAGVRDTEPISALKRRL